MPILRYFGDFSVLLSPHPVRDGLVRIAQPACTGSAKQGAASPRFQARQNAVVQQPGGGVV
jgi:hypothetical protein